MCPGVSGNFVFSSSVARRPTACSHVQPYSSSAPAFQKVITSSLSRTIMASWVSSRSAAWLRRSSVACWFFSARNVVMLIAQRLIRQRTIGSLSEESPWTIAKLPSVRIAHRTPTASRPLPLKKLADIKTTTTYATAIAALSRDEKVSMKKMAAATAKAAMGYKAGATVSCACSLHLGTPRPVPPRQVLLWWI